VSVCVYFSSRIDRLAGGRKVTHGRVIPVRQPGFSFFSFRLFFFLATPRKKPDAINRSGWISVQFKHFLKILSPLLIFNELMNWN
jgi:hypothetical protein